MPRPNYSQKLQTKDKSALLHVSIDQSEIAARTPKLAHELTGNTKIDRLKKFAKQLKASSASRSIRYDSLKSQVLRKMESVCGNRENRPVDGYKRFRSVLKLCRSAMEPQHCLEVEMAIKDFVYRRIEKQNEEYEVQCIMDRNRI